MDEKKSELRNMKKSKKLKQRFFSAFLILNSAFLLLFAGCAVGPDYKRPPVNEPPHFRGDAGVKTNSFGDMPWWELFRDDALQGLIRTALTNNYDIRIAVTRMEQANALLAESRAAYYPQLNYSGAVGRGKNAELGNAFPGVRQNQWYEAIGNVSWEIDLWGRLRRLKESVKAQYLATTEARNDVTISLISTLASDYFQLLALDRELQIARDTTNSFGESLKIFSERLKGGVASKLETSAAEAQEASAAATIPELQRQIFARENQISILLGTNPGPIIRGEKLLDEVLPPNVPPGLPSSLLERRPDIRESGQLVRSANAQIGVAKANFYPKFSLTGLFGQVSPEASAFTSGGANAWSAAADVAGPIFQGGLLKGELHETQAAWKETVLQYQATILNALQEVSNALEARRRFEEERVEQARAVTAYEEAVRVANERYRSGHANYYELLQEQQLLFPAENALTQAELNQLLANVQLYQALGGGWK